MDERDLELLLERQFDQRARLDVLERAVAIFMANADRQVAIAIEDQFRMYNERGVTSDNPVTADKLHRADMAAIRFADLLAESLSQK